MRAVWYKRLTEPEVVGILALAEPVEETSESDQHTHVCRLTETCPVVFLRPYVAALSRIFSNQAFASNVSTFTSLWSLAKAAVWAASAALYSVMFCL